MRAKVTNMLSHLSFEKSDVTTAIDVLRSGNVKAVAALQNKLKKCDADWTDEFLDMDGLQVRLAPVRKTQTGSKINACFRFLY